MAAAPQSGALSGDWRSSQFAALATQVNPEAAPSTSGLFGPAVFAAPYSLTYPSQPVAGATGLLGFYIPPDPVTGANYGPSITDSFSIPFGTSS